MKLKFSIRYHTAWGESLHVNIDFYSLDGTVRHQNLLMETEDGSNEAEKMINSISQHLDQI